jgi:hypothetical protein
MSCFPAKNHILDLPGTSKSYPFINYAIYNARVPSDPYFYGTLTLQNILDGSSYWVAQTADLTNVLGSGTQSGTADIAITNIPALSNPMLVTIRVRKAGYIDFQTNAYLYSSGGLSYIIQATDPTF